MNCQIHKINKFLSLATVSFKPHKRNIKYLNKYYYTSFDFNTLFLIPIAHFKNNYVRNDYTKVCGQLDNKDIVYPFNFPHVAPTECSFCLERQEDPIFNNIQELINYEINSFWNSNNEFYMNDMFQPIDDDLDFQQPKLNLNMPIATEILKREQCSYQIYTQIHLIFNKLNEKKDKLNLLLQFQNLYKINLDIMFLINLLKKENYKEIIDYCLKQTNNKEQQIKNLLKLVRHSKNENAENYLLTKGKTK